MAKWGGGLLLLYTEWLSLDVFRCYLFDSPLGWLGEIF